MTDEEFTQALAYANRVADENLQSPDTKRDKARVEELRALLDAYDRGDCTANEVELKLAQRICQDMMDGLLSSGQYAWQLLGYYHGTLRENKVTATFYTTKVSFRVERKATLLESIYQWLFTE